MAGEEGECFSCLESQTQSPAEGTRRLKCALAVLISERLVGIDAQWRMRKLLLTFPSKVQTPRVWNVLAPSVPLRPGFAFCNRIWPVSARASASSVQ